MGAVLNLSNFFRAAILQRTDEECAKLRSLRVLYARVSYVPAWLRAFTSNVPFFFYVLFVTSFFYLPYVPSFFTCLMCLHFFVSSFFTCLHFFTCLTCLHFYVPYVPCVPSVFTYLMQFFLCTFTFFKYFQLSKDVLYVPSPFLIKCRITRNQLIIFCACKKYFQYFFFNENNASVMLVIQFPAKN